MQAWLGREPPNDEQEALEGIVAAAIGLIGRSSAAISIADVAKALGVLRQTVYRYFADAEELMKAASIASV